MIRPSNSVALSHPFRTKRGKDGAPSYQYLWAGSIGVGEASMRRLEEGSRREFAHLNFTGCNGATG